LTSLLGEEEARTANKIIKEIDVEVTSKVKSSIAAHAKVFRAKAPEDRNKLKSESDERVKVLSYRRHHKVKCPACKCDATVQGETYGREKNENTEDEIIVRQSVIPTSFSCEACGLKLNGYGELTAANIADHFTHRINYSPEEFYELVNPNDEEALRSHMESYDVGLYFSNE
jgi:hypothetical protein